MNLFYKYAHLSIHQSFQHCGFLMFNPVRQVCDWPTTVMQIRPECRLDSSCKSDIIKIWRKKSVRLRPSCKSIRLDPLCKWVMQIRSKCRLDPSVDSHASVIMEIRHSKSSACILCPSCKYAKQDRLVASSCRSATNACRLKWRYEAGCVLKLLLGKR